MHMITGATGQVGATLAQSLLDNNEKVTVVIRNESKAEEWKRKGATVVLANVYEVASLEKAFAQGTNLFMMIPPADFAGDVMREEYRVLENYKTAINGSNLQKVVGLSSYGAQHASGTGHLLVSHQLEHLLDHVAVQKIILRPAYYYSNWGMALYTAQQEGVVYTFFPPDLKIAMVAPQDVGQLAASLMLDTQNKKTLYEIEGPQRYSPADVAGIFADLLYKKVVAQEIKPSDWQQTFMQIGFSETSALSYMGMTRSVIQGLTEPEDRASVYRGKTTLEDYLKGLIHHR